MLGRLRPHTILFAIYPVLFLYARNMAEVKYSAVVFPLLVAVAAATILGLLLSWVPPRPLKGGILATLLIVMFFSYGHVYEFANGWAHLRHRTMFPAWVLAWSVLLVLVARTRRSLVDADRMLTATSIIAVGMTAFTAVYFIVSGSGQRVVPPLAPVQRNAVGVQGEPLPDIYYVVLDAYASDPTLRDIYGYDNGPFVADLRRRGFFVASLSRSNYSMTLPSSAATLNMDYLPQLTKLAGTPSKDNRGFTSLIDSNRVERILRANGYATIRINAPPEMFHRDFSGMLLRTTLLATADFSRSRERTLDVLRRLYQARPTGAPTFVYCHIMCPHDPYVFGPHGEPKSLLEQNQAMSSLPARRRAYVDQVQFMNSRVDSLLDLIMARKDRRSIVILQADHGPRNEAPMDKPTARSLREGAGILNAYYLPDGGSRGLYDSISPVNSFRLVLRNYLGFDYELLPDRSYHNVPKHQYQVIPVPLVSSVAGTALAAP